MKLSILLILYSCLLIAQGQRFIYNYTFANDSLNLQNKQNEFVALDVSTNGSIFYSQKVNEIDSTYNLRDPKAGSPKFLGYPYRDVLFHEVILAKKNSSPQLYYMGGPTRNYYEIQLNEPINWKIFPDTKKIEIYSAQKAEAVINSRKWEVWFTKDIPIPTGPYIFSGLPGLIITAHDIKGSQVFELVSVHKLKEVDLDYLPMFQNKQMPSNNTKVILTKKEFKKLLVNNDDQFINNVIPSNNAQEEVVSSKFYDSSGNEMSKSDYLRGQQEKRRAILKRNNNKLINDFKK